MAASSRRCILFGIYSAIAFSCMAIALQKGPSRTSSEEFLFYRSIISMVLLFPFIKNEFPSLFQKENGFVWVRSLFGCLALLCYFWTTKTGGAALAKAISSTSPIFVTIFSYMFFRERISLQENFGLIICGVGILILICNGYGDTHYDNYIMWFCVAILGAIFTGLAFTALKQATKKSNPLLIVWSLCLITAIVCFRPSFESPLAYDLNEWLWIVSVAGFALIGQVTLTLSYVSLSGGVATLLSLLALPILIAYDFFVASVIHTLLEVIPYFLILGGIIITCYRPKNLEQSS